MSYRERISDVIVTIEVEGFEPEPCAALAKARAIELLGTGVRFERMTTRFGDPMHMSTIFVVSYRQPYRRDAA